MNRLLCFALTLLSLTFGLTTTAAAAGFVTSSLMVPFTGLFNAGAGNEPVALTGRVHIVTQLYPTDPCFPSDPCRVFINLADLHGVGQNSGRAYVAVGATVLYPNDPCTPTDPCQPVDPCIPNDPCRASFVIMPVSTPSDPNVPGNPVLPITFFVVLAFDSNGRVMLEGTTVSLHGTCTSDITCLSD